MTELTRSELQEMLDEAARKGAKTALETIGLHDEGAANDIREVRGLLDSWRDAKRTAWKTTVNWAVTLFLGALIVGAWVKSGGTINIGGK